jgi:UDP-N-acetylglucosamine acyltransferase
MPDIHSSAVIDPGADIGPDVSIGPYCIVGPHAVIAPGCRLIAHVHVTGHTTIGARTVLYPFVSLGTPPQSVKYRGGATRLIIGADCDLRESVTMNTGTEDGGGQTTVGDRGLFMAYSHVGHDCQVGHDVTFANAATLAGHCTIGDHVFMGGLTAVHQFTRVGAHAMIAGMTGVRSDVIPFAVATGVYARLRGLNVIGLKRGGFSHQTLHLIRSAYHKLFFDEGLFNARLDVVEAKFGRDPAVAQMVAFVRAGSARSLCQPGGRHED